MIVQPNRADMPPQLRPLSAKAQDLPEPVRDALSETAPDATPEQVLADVSAQLGYLSKAAKQARLLP